MTLDAKLEKAVSDHSYPKMRLVFLTHPAAFAPVSMRRFAGMIMRGMTERGHEVEAWTSDEKIGRLRMPFAYARKWLGYFDQFLIYPRKLRKLVEQQPANTLFVIADQALGMWLPCLAHRPHAIHCHDFLALKSALGEFPENPTRWTGRRYQRLIWKGFSRGNAFISVSKKTRDDLHRFLPSNPKVSEVVHNRLNYPFRPMELAERISLLKTTGIEISEHGFILHVGGNQWYKNQKGVLEIYRSYAISYPKPLALWMVGCTPTNPLLNLAASIPNPGKVHFLIGLTNEQINAAYSHARVLLYPSLEEGFGWPVVEAMASDCPVITTNLAPMTEVAGEAARLIPRMPANGTDRGAWASSASGILQEVVRLNGSSRAKTLLQGRLNAARFDAKKALASYEGIYSREVMI
jgi:glycosyltransferase involved in cell wall biosynthesis